MSHAAAGNDETRERFEELNRRLIALRILPRVEIDFELAGHCRASQLDQVRLRGRIFAFEFVGSIGPPPLGQVGQGLDGRLAT